MPFRPTKRSHTYRAEIAVKGPIEDKAAWKRFRKALKVAVGKLKPRFRKLRERKPR